MIIPMKKYSFLIHHAEFQPFLEDLQDLGVLDVVEKEAESDKETSSLLQRSDQLNKVIGILKPRIDNSTARPTSLSPDEILNKVTKMQAESDASSQRITMLDKSYRSLLPWGDFSKDVLRKLADEGFYIRFFVAQEKKFKASWKSDFNLEVINNSEGRVYFVIIQRGDETIEIDAEEVKAPEHSASEVLKEKRAIENSLEQIEAYFTNNAAAFVPVLEKEKASVDNQVSFDNVISNTESEADNKVMVLEGWVPKQKVPELEDFLEKKNVFYLSSNPTPGDNVPVKLKNGKFSRLFEPIGNLYSLPTYGELDITPFFAPFYMLFFGFCLGDAGYGLLIMIGTLISLAFASKKAKPLLILGFLLGLSTTIMGIIGGTFFGVFLADQPWTWLKSYQEHFVLNNDQMMLFALGLGYAQVLFGMFLKAANQIIQFGWKFAVSQFGWILIVMFTIPFFVMTKMDLIPPEIGTKVWIITGVLGAIPAFLFNSPGKNIFLNIGTGAWQTYGMASGLLGDVLSYIRLFALGISSAILGNVFNTLAMDLSPDTIVVRQIVMILILAFGHSLNFFMAVLGSFVHPLRLTFVEFYKNAGFAGGGNQYKPFSKVEME
jgi:V/A-type H+-transporting ATPase subunit I